MRITKRQLRRIVKEETRRLAEDSVSDELDHLRANIKDDEEHIDNLEKDIEDEREEEERAHEDHKHHESRTRGGRRLTYRGLRKMIREEHEDWGMGAGEESRTHPGEEDYTGHKGDESETHPGEEDYEGGGVEDKAKDAVQAIHDLASAAGVDLGVDEIGAGEEEYEEVEYDIAVEGRKRISRSQLRRIVREVKRRRR